MRKLALFTILFTTSVHAEEVSKESNALWFNPAPVEKQAKLVPVQTPTTPKTVKSYLIVNGVWLDPVIAAREGR